MKEPQDCTYPQENLCLHECCEGCVRKRTRRQHEEALAEDEAFALAQAHENQRLMLSCEYLGICMDRPERCPNCPNERSPK